MLYSTLSELEVFPRNDTCCFFQVNPNWAIDLVAEEPVVVCDKRVVFSDGGGPLGHPRVYINLVSKNK